VNSVERLIKIADGVKEVRQRRWRRPRHIYFTLDEQLDAISELGRSGSVAAWRYIQRLLAAPDAKGPLRKALYSGASSEMWTDRVGDRRERDEAAEHERTERVIQAALRQLTRALYEDQQRATCARLEVEFLPSDVFDYAFTSRRLDPRGPHGWVGVGQAQSGRGILALEAVRAPDITAPYSNWVCVEHPTFDLADFEKFNRAYGEGGIGIHLHRLLAAYPRLAPYLGLPRGARVVLDERQDRVVFDAKLARLSDSGPSGVAGFLKAPG
jgi:hypothetical protein